MTIFIVRNYEAKLTEGFAWLAVMNQIKVEKIAQYFVKQKVGLIFLAVDFVKTLSTCCLCMKIQEHHWHRYRHNHQAYQQYVLVGSHELSVLTRRWCIDRRHLRSLFEAECC